MPRIARAHRRGAAKRPNQTPASGRATKIDQGLAVTQDGDYSLKAALETLNASVYSSSARTRPVTSRTYTKDIYSQRRGSLSRVVILRVAPDKLRALCDTSVHRDEASVKVPVKNIRLLARTYFQRQLPLEPVRKLGQSIEANVVGMAPIQEDSSHNVLDDHLKEVIQNLYDLGNITHGYLPESQDPLVKKSLDLTRSLASLSALTADDSTHPAAPQIRSITMPPEVIDYVANGRNPDIYTRQFIENVQRGNHVLNGKMQAFGSFAEIYARETKSAIPYLAADMDRLMEHSGGFERIDGNSDWKAKKTESKES